MRLRKRILLLIALCALVFGFQGQRPAETAEQVAAGTYIFVFDDSVAGAEVPGLVELLTGNFGGQVSHVYQTALRGFAVRMTEAGAAAMGRQSFVKYYEKDAVVRTMQGNRPGGGGSSGQTIPWGVERVGGPKSGVGKTAFVIDTGIDLSHADLNVDLARSANFVTRGKNSPDDGNGHGTHVAGTIGGKNNDIDVVGVAADANLVAVRVLDNSGSGTFSWVIAGIDYVAANGKPGDVANMSLGAKSTNTSLDDAVKKAADKGILFAIAAGNSGEHSKDYTPARVEHTNVYTVSASNDSDFRASWSNWGIPPVDFAAPGVGILSTRKGGGTTTMSGTSMAAPHVAGILLLGGVRSDGVVKNKDPEGNQEPIARF
jgi:subtilisin family serine protease